ncbi:MAG: MFS transporter, partial [Aestuariivirga sp.]
MTFIDAVRARWAVGAMFLLHGILIGSWVPHIPLAKERLDAGPAVFGLALLAFAGGAVVAMPTAGMLINRFGSARMSGITGILFCLTFFGPILAPTMSTFVV